MNLLFSFIDLGQVQLGHLAQSISDQLILPELWQNVLQSIKVLL